MAVAFTLLGLLMSNATVTYQQLGVSLGFTVALFNGQHVLHSINTDNCSCVLQTRLQSLRISSCALERILVVWNSSSRKCVNVTKVRSVVWQEVQADARLTVSPYNGPAVTLSQNSHLHLAGMVNQEKLRQTSRCRI